MIVLTTFVVIVFSLDPHLAVGPLPVVAALPAAGQVVTVPPSAGALAPAPVLALPAPVPLRHLVPAPAAAANHQVLVLVHNHQRKHRHPHHYHHPPINPQLSSVPSPLLR